MKNLTCLALFASLLCVPCLPVQSQQTPLSKKITAGEKKETDAAGAANLPTTSLPYRPLSDWTGARFIFLPRPKSSQSGRYADFVGAVTYSKYVGRVARVVSVTDFSGRAHLEFELEDNGERLRARTTTGSISGIALAEDLDYARAHWLGRTLWSREMSLLIWNEQTDEMGALRIKKCAPLKVVEIAPGWDEQKPVRFMLETTSGERGFLDVNLSGVNARQESQNLSRLEQLFFIADPWANRKWSPGVRAAIESGKIMPGMTAEQVRMSWGEPEKITRVTPGSSEKWSYPGSILLFKYGVLSAFQQ